MKLLPSIGLKHYLKLLRMRYSAQYSNDIAHKYWSNPTSKMHGDSGITEQAYEDYANGIECIIKECNVFKNELPSSLKVLDYGAGDGEITWRMRERGFSNIEACDLIPALVEEIKKHGIEAFTIEKLSKKYDIIYSNNALFYVHPTKIIGCIKNLLAHLNENGVLIVTDIPVTSKIRTLFKNESISNFKVFMLNHTLVYSDTTAGFFFDERMIKNIFARVKIIDSVCDYRSNFIFEK